MTVTADLHLNPTAPRRVEETRPLVDGRATHPLYNEQKMKLGLFGNAGRRDS